MKFIDHAKSSIGLSSLVLPLAIAALQSSAVAADKVYEPQGYVAVVNSRKDLAAKENAMTMLAKAWPADHCARNQVSDVLLKGTDFSRRQILSVLNDQLTGKIDEVRSHFNSDGSWKPGLPKGTSLSDSQYSKHHQYTVDLLALAYLYRFVETNDRKKRDLKQTVFKSIRWYFDNGYEAPPEYHKTFSYHSTEKLIAGVFLLTGHLFYEDLHRDRLSNKNVDLTFQYIREYCRQFINSKPQIRGANWTYRYHNCMLYVLFTNQVEDMDEFMHHWKSAISFNRWEKESDGVYPDWSMLHHGDMNYWGMYGAEWLQKVIEVGELLNDTPWAYSGEELDFIANCIIKGARWSVYRGVCEYSTAPKRGSFLLGRTDKNSQELKALSQRLINLDRNKMTRINKLKKVETRFFNPPWTAAGANEVDKPEIRGHRYFWNSEYQVHRRPDYAIYVRRCSQRVRPPEDSANKKAKFHLNYGTGYTPILRRGDELRLSRLAWDFQKVPGTTVEQIGDTASGKAASTIRGLNIFSGGVADGPFGCGAFDMEVVQYNKRNNGKYEYKNGAAALKGTFFLDKGMIALGQNVRRVADINGKQEDILTTVNNVRRLTDVVYSIDGARTKSVSADRELTLRKKITNVAWFHHDGIGYVVWPSKNSTTEIVLSLGDQPFNSVLKTDRDFQKKVTAELGRAAWNKGSFNMFQLFIDHGRSPNMDSYKYAVLPNCTADETEDFADSTSVKTINADGIQGVYDTDNEICYASFTKSGTARFGSGKKLSVDRPLVVMARKKKNGVFAFTASNPEHRGMRQSYIPGSGKTVGSLYETPVIVRRSGFGADTDVEFSLSTERGEEGKSVSGK